MRHFSRGVVSCLVATLPLAACSDSTTPSIPLAEMPLRFQGGSRAIFSTLSVYVGYANPSDGVDGPMIIDTVELTGPTPAAEVRTPGAPGFAEAVAQLTDSIDEVIEGGYLLGGGSGGGGYGSGLESRFIGGGISGTLDPDFAGYTITKIVLTADTLTFATPGRDPNGDGLWTDYLFAGRVIVEGYQN